MFGDVLIIDTWHRQRGWSGIGYHYVILNGKPYRDGRYIDFLDGQIQPGHSLNADPIFQDFEVGAHVAGRNASSLGVCLIGTVEFTDAQLLTSRRLILSLLRRFNLPIDAVKGHTEDPNANKTCPNIPMDYYRQFLKDNGTLHELQQHIEQHVKTLRLG